MSAAFMAARYLARPAAIIGRWSNDRASFDSGR
jgi:hypothetical protein